MSHVHLIMPFLYAVERLHLPHEIYVTGNIKNHNGISNMFLRALLEWHSSGGEEKRKKKLISSLLSKEESWLHDLIQHNEFYNLLNRVRTSFGNLSLRKQKEFLCHTSNESVARLQMEMFLMKYPFTVFFKSFLFCFGLNGKYQLPAAQYPLTATQYF